MRRPFKNILWMFSVTVLFAGCFALGAFARNDTVKNPLTPAVRTVFLPFQRMAQKAANSVNTLILRVSDDKDKEKENKDLKEEIAQLKQEIRAQTALYAENERLRSLLQFKKENPSYQMVSARVFSKTKALSSVTFCVDKGTEYGIKKDDTVLKNRSLIGKVTDVGDGWSEVKTLLSHDFQVGARVVRTQENGVVAGDAALLKRACVTLSFLEDGASPAVGDTIETSGMGGVFPKGLLIGTVESVSNPPHGETSAVVELDVDFNRLYEVSIIKKET